MITIIEGRGEKRPKKKREKKRRILLPFSGIGSIYSSRRQRKRRKTKKKKYKHSVAHFIHFHTAPRRKRGTPFNPDGSPSWKKGGTNQEGK